MDPLTTFSIVALITGSILTVFSRIPKETIKNQKDLIEAQDQRLKNLEEGSIEKDKAIAVLGSKVDVLQTIPLGSIADAIKEIVHTQIEIIKLIKEK